MQNQKISNNKKSVSVDTSAYAFTDTAAAIATSIRHYGKSGFRLSAAFLMLGTASPLLAANPTMPEDLRSSVYSVSAAELFWNASTDADGIASYRVYIAGTLYREVPGTSIYIDVLNAGTRYDFQISAVDSTGSESRWTDVHSLMTGTPANVAETSPVMPDRAPAAQATSEQMTATDELSAQPTSEQAEEVVVEESAVDEAESIVAPSTTLPDQDDLQNPVDGNRTIEAPVALSVVEQSDSSVSLVWEQDPQSVAAAGYNLYLGNSYIATTTSPDFQIRGLNADSSYRVIVTAFDFDGNFSGNSDVVVARTLSAGSEPVVSAQTPVTDADADAESSEEPDNNQVVVSEPGVSTDGDEPTEEEISPEAEAPIVETELVDVVQPVVVANSEPTVEVIDRNDFFGRALEIDNEPAQAGAAPTKPKNLRANLVSNDWVELNWAPSNDDGEVVEYRIHRDDGVMYSISAGDDSGDVETSRTLMNFWNTTTYMDCNYTHVRVCHQNDSIPEEGALHTYQVSAVDDEGNVSELSDPLTVKMHERPGAILEPYTDPYLDGDDEFLFQTDLTETANFMDQFELVFADEFNGDEIDTSKWSTSLTWNQADNIINGEMQYFVDTERNPDFGYNPFILNGETLTISAIQTPPELSERALGQPFLSGALSTHETRSGQLDENGNVITDKFATTYGYIEGRIRVGQIPGMLTSFYLFRRWAGEHAPEIDIIEYLGENPFGEEKAFQTYHYQDASHGEILSSPTMQYPHDRGHLGDELDLDGFHTYSALWEPGLVIWYIDGHEVQRLTGRQVGRQSMNIILYLVAGSAWAPRPADDAPFPLEIEVDYIRAYKRLPWQGGSGS